MKKLLGFPLDIQLFAEGEGNQATPPAANATPPASQTIVSEIDYERVAETVAKRSAGTEDKVLQGYFKSQGLSPEQANEAMQQYKQAQATKQQQEATQLQTLANENAQLKAQMMNAKIDTKIAELASTLGVQSEKIPFISKLVERKNFTKEDDSLDDGAIKTSLEEVLKAFPDFKGTTQQGGFQQIGGAGQNTGANVTDEQLNAIFGVTKK